MGSQWCSGSQGSTSLRCVPTVPGRRIEFLEIIWMPYRRSMDEVVDPCTWFDC